MLAGKPPFDGEGNLQLYNSICTCNYSFPENFPKTAKNLIKKLLKLNPFERLGAGEESSKLSMNDLKAHPFFDGIDFDNLLETQPPISSNSKIKALKNTTQTLQSTIGLAEEKINHIKPKKKRKWYTNPNPHTSYDVADDLSKNSG